MNDAQKLRTLADWFDAKDRRDLARELNVTESEIPDYMLTGSQVEVQKDLRRIAESLEQRPTELAVAWDEGEAAGRTNEHEYRPNRLMRNPFREEAQT